MAAGRTKVLIMEQPPLGDGVARSHCWAGAPRTMNLFQRDYITVTGKWTMKRPGLRSSLASAQHSPHGRAIAIL
jgi:hypothetical protein